MAESEDNNIEVSLGLFSDSDGEEENIFLQNGVSDEDDPDDEDSGQNASSIIYHKNGTFSPNVEEFEDSEEFIKPEFNVDITSTPLEILEKFIDVGMVQEIVEETNRYVRQLQRSSQRSMRNWQPATVAEIWQFFALTLMMGIVVKPEIADYWSLDPLLATPFFSQIMSRNRFQNILRGFHLVNNEAVPSTNRDRYVKLGSFTQKLFANLTKKIKAMTGDNRSTNFLIQRISLAIQRGNQASIYGTLPPGKELEEIFNF